MSTHDDIERQQNEWHARARAAQAAAAQAYERLLCLAETRDSGQIGRIARFLASTYDGQTFPFNLFDLRTFDIGISDDMLVCLDALRWGKADLHKLIPDGDQRVRAVLDRWGIKWPEAS